MRLSTLVVLCLTACGRTEPVEGLETEGLGGGAGGGGGVEPVPTCTANTGKLVKLGQAAHATVTGLEVRGDDLYVSSRYPFIPMLYRLVGSVERFPRCGGEATWVVGELDHPSSLVVSSQWVHWRSTNFDSGGTNRNNYVMTRTRTGTGPLQRDLSAEDDVSNVVRVGNELRWVRQRASDHVLEGSEEGGVAVRTVGQFTAPDKAGPGQLFALDDGRIAQIIRSTSGSTVNVISADAGTRVTLFTLEQQALPIGIVEGDWLLYSTVRAGQILVAKRRLVTQNLETRLTILIGINTAVAAVDGPFVYFGLDRTFLRVPLDGAMPVKLDLAVPGDEVIQHLRASDGKLYFSTGREGLTAPPATLWAYTL